MRTPDSALSADAIRLSDTASIVAAVPYLLGHRPCDSVVVIGLRPTGTVGPVLRVDTPGPRSDGRAHSDRGAVLALADHLATVLLGQGCGQAVLTLHVGVDPPDVVEPAVGLLVSVLEEAVDLVDVVQVGPLRYRSLRCNLPSCCPATGLPVADVGHHPVAASFVLAGRRPAEDRGSLEPAGSATAAERRSAAAAARRWRARPVDDEALGGVFEDWCRVLAEPVTQHLPAPLAGRLAAAWHDDVRARDAAGLACLPGGPVAAKALLDGAGASAGAGLATVLADRGCAGAVGAVGWAFRRLAAVVGPRDRATVLACHAWVAWASGEGIAAVVLVERAFSLDPTHSLARLVRQCVDTGVGPPWTQRDAGFFTQGGA